MRFPAERVSSSPQTLQRSSHPLGFWSLLCFYPLAPYPQRINKPKPSLGSAGVCQGARTVLRKPTLPGMSIMLEELGTDIMLKEIRYEVECDLSMTKEFHPV